ncbi:MAG: hypothetical protein NZ927_01930 [Candidatus Calescibacterium sp.]|nr:hypothetical protein [Candidatus Calescibacterium sp.]MDW8086823.1 hypothetical protein [Candidatus Calescibacterium sp.]
MIVISKLLTFDKLFDETFTKNVIYGSKAEYHKANYKFDIKSNNLYRNLKEIFRDLDNK